MDAPLPHRRAGGVGGSVARAEGPDVRVEAAAYRGRPVWFEVITPWTKPERMGGDVWPKGKLVKQLTSSPSPSC